MKTTLTPYRVCLVVATLRQASLLTARFPKDRIEVDTFTSLAAVQASQATTRSDVVVVAAECDQSGPLLAAMQQKEPPVPVVVIAPTNCSPSILGAATILLAAHSTTADLVWNAVHRLLTLSASTSPDFGPHLLGRSAAMAKVFRLVQKAAVSGITVSLQGETGTGKEEVARAIHYHSARAAGPFVALNMAAIPRELLESELFGHEKGAFTGAVERRTGYFELAHGGTLFLDEIAELEPSLQAKLLRVVQEKTFTRVGGSQAIAFDARLIVATHADLIQRIKEGRFREDLYYRLLGLTILLPPLRDRIEDTLLLADKFLQDFCPIGQQPCILSAAAKTKLLSYPYPGNVRELRAVLELAAVLADDSVIQAEHIAFPPTPTSPMLETQMPIDGSLTLREHTIQIVQHYLDHYRGDVQVVAARLGIGKSTIYRMISSGEVKV